MKKIKTLFIIALLAASSGTALAAPQSSDNVSLNAPICAKCHQGESNMMLGFLKDVSYKADTILMDLLTHKEVVYFDEDSRIKNLETLEEMQKYKGKGFRIYFAEENDRKIAVHITRFDILQLVDDDAKLSREAVESLMLAGNPLTFVDVRPGKHYMAGHIDGAINVPAPAFEKFKTNLPADKNQTLVVYGVGGCLSPSVAVNAMAMGYNDVRIYTSGFPEWAKYHYTMASPGYVKQGITDNSLVILDLRPATAARIEHLPGAISAPMASLASIKEKLPADKKAPIILYGPGSVETATTVNSWGYKRVRLLEGDFAGWKNEGLPTKNGPLAEKILYVAKAKAGVILPADFKALAAQRGNSTLIDVRNSEEYAAGHIAGSINIAVDDLEDQLSELPTDQPIVTFCNSGLRAEIAFNILKNHDYPVRYLDTLLQISTDGSVNIDSE